MMFMSSTDMLWLGVQWLWELYCQEAGGIIGDEMVMCW